MPEDNYSLEHFEFLCYSRNHEAAARELVRLLLLIDRHYGKLSNTFSLAVSPALPAAELEAHALTRLTSAISALFSDPGFRISPDGFGQLIHFQRWLSSLFAASAFVNADHLLQSLNTLGPTADDFQVNSADLVKFCVLYSAESEVPLDVELLWRQNRDIAAALFMALLSPRLIGTQAAHSKREALLAWLPSRLEEIDSLDTLPVGILHDAYMHCSYADLPQRHDIKASINRLVERKLAAADILDLPTTTPRPTNADKPVMLVLLEWFSAGHSIYRTHSRTLEAARADFQLVAIGYQANVDDAGREVFDHFVAFDEPDDLYACLRQLRSVAQAWAPQVFYMPSVGMFPITLFASNLRLAPLQVAALGHPATTRSRHIDYISVEEDFIGDPACFSERLLRLPADGQPYRPSAHVVALPKRQRQDSAVVHVAIAATTMKLNPRFLLACQKIVELTPQLHGREVRLHFLIGQAQGLLYPQVVRLIQRYVPQAVVYAHQPYQDYLAIFNQCDMFLSPLPFGNTNGIIDALTVGLPGICKTGPEVFEHIDEGLFRRVGLPDWTITHTLEEYIRAACRLAGNFAEREALYRQLERPEALQRLFSGRPQALSQALSDLLKTAP
ncbi:peptide transporter [Pseudomonas gingeri]|uniref:Peptide transporter n=1 Tax=Pseudomonas gingeri TaxID=117681 RepID=A0A7Y8CJR3_9PSED|nr:peptide transporter [Pseudomonas gingeri]NWB26956.1 peptide transporter [Pseudomonas gingeri]NWC32494.1 peptide transporter [Pseudomonas gingeri]NWD05210.1 peptide transporter [Pseudomonas gingeri]NWE27011.1 peptide transporter [Pseudomonas gingeri]NWE36378.1 peptide transporter [Pseudomonas gingeri]